MTPEPCNPDRLPADRMAFVEDVHQQFLQTFGQRLSADLDTPVKAVPAGIEQQPVAEFLAASASDACVLIFDLAPVRGQAWAGLSRELVFRVLDILLNAPQPAGPSTRTALTEIETHLLREFFERLSQSLDQAWKSGGLSLRMSAVGTAQEVRGSVDPEDTALVLKCQVKFGEEETAFRVAMPVLSVRLAALENERKAAGDQGQDADRAAVLEALSGASLELEAVLRGSTIRLGDLAVLHPGQILMLSSPAGSQLECLINGKPKFRGEWVADGDRQGLHVDALVDAATAGK